jgi:hypothetical protein
LGRRNAGDGDTQPLLGQVGNQVAEPGTLVAQQVGDRHLDVVEEELGGVLGVEADLVQVAAPVEAGHARLDHHQ